MPLNLPSPTLFPAMLTAKGVGPVGPKGPDDAIWLEVPPPNAGSAAHMRGPSTLFEQRTKLLWSEYPVALGHEFSDLLPVRVAGEKHPNAVVASSPRGEEWVANGQQRLAVVRVGTQYHHGDGLTRR